ncbi:MAG: hypothetical protein V1861_03285 [Candidatus Micrarchaeota archaeon]
MVFDTITSVNLVLCVLIVLAGYLAFKKDKGAAWLYLALAFALFALSHVVTLAGSAEALYEPMIAIRALGYLFVLFAIYKGTVKVSMSAEQAPAKPSRKKK